jgi:hypothetical protein
MEQHLGHVPVFVDNARYTEELGAIRFTYFYVERFEAEATAYLEAEDAPQMLLLDLEGVIVSGVGGKRLLDTVEAIDELFEFIADRSNFVVATSYIWLPELLLRRTVGAKLSRGDVVRVYTPLFVQACTAAGPTRELPLDDVPPDVQPLYLSEAETEAFREWAGRTVERVQKRYRERPEKNLRTRYESTGV